MNSSYEVTTTAHVADEILEYFNSGQLPEVTTLKKQEADPFGTKPVGSDAIVVLVLSFVVQTGAAVTAEVIKNYLAKKLNKKDTNDEISVNEVEDPNQNRDAD